MPPLVERYEEANARGVAKRREAKKPENVAAGQRVKRRRKELGLTQQELGGRIGLKTSTAKHEQGAYGFSGETLTRFAKELGVTERWILYGEERVPESTVEDAWTDTAAWLELETGGRIDYYRARGVPESQIQQIRRTDFRGPPEPGDYELMLEGALRNAVRYEHPLAREAREEHARTGGPDLSDLLRPRQKVR